MELLPVIRRLWRRRLLLVVGLVFAGGLAVALGGAPPSAGVVAWTRVALDTPQSQLIDAAPGGADTLTWRASLIVHLMTTDAVQHQLAQRLGIAADQIAVVDPALAVPEVPASMPVAAADAAVPTGTPYMLTVYVTKDLLPLISLEAVAPRGFGAERLAAAGLAVLRSQASRGGPYRSLILTDPAEAQRLQPFVVQQVAPIRTMPIAPSKRAMVTRIGAPVFAFLLWMAALTLVPGFRRSRLSVRRVRASSEDAWRAYQPRPRRPERLV